MGRFSRLEGRGRKFMRTARVVLIGLVVLSVIQFANDGKVSWPGQVIDQFESAAKDYVGRPEASWRKATDVLNDIVPAEGTSDTFDIRGRVVRVYDGDTLSVLDGQNKQYRIRLHGIDTPEYDQPHGNLATKALTDLLDGATVGVVIKDVDRLDRTVAVVYKDGVNINLAMVKAGHAWWYKNYARSATQLRAAQSRAREEKLGLWAKPNPVEPWEWRRGRRS